MPRGEFILVLMSDVTQILSKIESGDAHASEELLPVVYEELRKLAAAKLAKKEPGETLSATSLVHEAYVRLVDIETAQHWNSRGHFFGAAAEAMKRILVEKARRERRMRHGVERLLRANDKLGDFLQNTPQGIEETARLSDHENPGTSIGPYKIREKLAEGGMGVVYVAELTEPVRRKVALKVIKPDLPDHPRDRSGRDGRRRRSKAD